MRRLRMKAVAAGLVERTNASENDRAKGRSWKWCKQRLEKLIFRRNKHRPAKLSWLGRLWS